MLHVGTNDLLSDRPPNLIAKSIVDLASSMKKEKLEVTVSNIIARAMNDYARIMHKMRFRSSFNKLIKAHLKVNSVRHKFES